MKITTKEWFETFPEPWRTQALANLRDNPFDADSGGRLHETPAGALDNAFDWAETTEDDDYWAEIHNGLLEDPEYLHRKAAAEQGKADTMHGTVHGTVHGIPPVMLKVAPDGERRSNYDWLMTLPEPHRSRVFRETDKQGRTEELKESVSPSLGQALMGCCAWPDVGFAYWDRLQQHCANSPGEPIPPSISLLYKGKDDTSMEMKVRDWFGMLPMPIYDYAINASRESHNGDAGLERDAGSLGLALDAGINWGGTDEGRDYWEFLSTKLDDNPELIHDEEFLDEAESLRENRGQRTLDGWLKSMPEPYRSAAYTAVTDQGKRDRLHGNNYGNLADALTGGFSWGTAEIMPGVVVRDWSGIVGRVRKNPKYLDDLVAGVLAERAPAGAPKGTSAKKVLTGDHTMEQWLDAMVPEPFRSIIKAENIRQKMNEKLRHSYYRLCDAFSGAFCWTETPQGDAYWRTIHTKLKDNPSYLLENAEKYPAAQETVSPTMAAVAATEKEDTMRNAKYSIQKLISKAKTELANNQKALELRAKAEKEFAEFAKLVEERRTADRKTAAPDGTYVQTLCTAPVLAKDLQKALPEGAKVRDSHSVCVYVKVPRVTDYTARLKAAITDLGMVSTEEIEYNEIVEFLLQDFSCYNGATQDDKTVGII